MKPLDIYLYIALAIGIFGGSAATLWLYLYTKKKYPDEKKAGGDRPSV